jgi:hypothetical protein
LFALASLSTMAHAANYKGKGMECQKEEAEEEADEFKKEEAEEEADPAAEDQELTESEEADDRALIVMPTPKVTPNARPAPKMVPAPKNMPAAAGPKLVATSKATAMQKQKQKQKQRVTSKFFPDEATKKRFYAARFQNRPWHDNDYIEPKRKNKGKGKSKSTDTDDDDDDDDYFEPEGKNNTWKGYAAGKAKNSHMMHSENYEVKVASRDYSDSAMENRKKLIDAAKTARQALRARLLGMPLPAPNDLEGGVSQPAHDPRSDLPELRREPLQGSSHPAVAGQSVSNMPSIARNDLESVVSQTALESHEVSSVPSIAPSDLEGGVSQPAVEGHIEDSAVTGKGREVATGSVVLEDSVAGKGGKKRRRPQPPKDPPPADLRMRTRGDTCVCVTDDRWPRDSEFDRLGICINCGLPFKLDSATGLHDFL